MMQMTIVGSVVQAKDVQEGDFLLGLDNGYVYEVEEGNGYLSYPRTSYGMSVGMPEDTIIIGYHDVDGNENFLLSSPDAHILIRREN